jgi:hypothetical protein
MADPAKMSKKLKEKARKELAEKQEAEMSAAPVAAPPVVVEDVPEEVTEDTAPKEIASRATADCESAKEAACSCRCRGKYHGKPHPRGWKDEEGCEPLTKDERKVAKKNALYAWRKAHPERVSAYMKQWREERKSQEAAAAEETVTAEDQGEE